MRIQVNVNGELREADVEPRLLLVHFIRDTLGLTGTHWGCDTSNCGACTVHLDGEPVKSCTVLAVRANGHNVTTIKGVSRGADLSLLQQGFREEHGLQCGFCTPGFVLTAVGVLERQPDIDEAALRRALGSSICRCTGYTPILAAVRAAQRELAAAP